MTSSRSQALDNFVLAIHSTTTTMSRKVFQQNVEVMPTSSQKTLFQSYIQTIHYIRNTLIQPDANEQLLKTLQSKLSPWTLEHNIDDVQYKEFSQSIYQFHTTARWYFQRQEDPEWKQWFKNLHDNDIQKWLELPSRTNTPQLLKASETDVAWVHNSVFHPEGMAKTIRTQLQKLNIRLEQPIRMITPALYSSNNEIKTAIHDLFPGIEESEINKLPFWAMIGNENTVEERQYMLKQKPRYLGGPQGSSLWLLHGATPGTQATSKARTAMLSWMIHLTEHLVDIRDRKSELIWTPQHSLVLHMYERALHAVLSTAATHKRSLDQMNELHSLSTRAAGQLILRGAPEELVHNLQQTQECINSMLLDKPVNFFKRRAKLDTSMFNTLAM